MTLADLTKRYQEKSEEELLRFAADSLHLTPEARTVLRGELAKRGISAEHWHVPDNASCDDKAETGFKHIVLRSSEAKLIEDGWRLYRNRVWLFVTLIAPAVSIGALALLVSRYEVREILKHFPRGLDTFQHRAELFEIMVLKASRNIITGFTFCLCFGAICAAVEQIESGLVVSIGECLEAVRQQLRRVLQLSLVLLTLLILVEVLTFLVSQGIYWGILQRYFSYASGILFLPLAYLISALGLLVLSRLGLAMPAIILDDYTVANALFRSDELTEGKWLTLAVLLFKCIVVGYVAALWPFWLAQWIPNTISLPAWFPWFLWIASVMAVAFVEPVMFIGFALLYIRES